jgi:hypothetical protein
VNVPKILLPERQGQKLIEGFTETCRKTSELLHSNPSGQVKSRYLLPPVSALSVQHSPSFSDDSDARSDVAARGLDIPLVSLVINVTFPLTIEDFIHRIGRTGRSGKKGKSITFFTSDDKAHAGELVRVIRDAGQGMLNIERRHIDIQRRFSLTDIPQDLMQFGTTIKKKVHSSYGNHFRDDIQGTSKKIRFD